LANTRFSSDPLPIDETCSCYTCRFFTHTCVTWFNPGNGATLLTILNLNTLLALGDIRQSIVEVDSNTFRVSPQWKRDTAPIHPAQRYRV
jgi:tRNA-guanine family transglycosylase